MANVEKKTTYSVELTGEEYDAVKTALDAIACDEDTYGEYFAKRCFQIWKGLDA